MPILWRYLLIHFYKVVFFCTLAFVAILLTMQLDEIAHFVALGAPIGYILLFTFYQIPYILPIAIPISCLIASFILIQRLSGTCELTALRATGFSLRDIFAPILISAAFLVLFNFWIVSEVATHSHLTNNLLKNELRSINPLLLLNNKHLMRLKGIYFDALGPSRVGESAHDVILAIPNAHQQRINLLLAKRLRSAPSLFEGQGATFLTSLDSKEEENFDHLLIENMETMVTSNDDFSQLIQKKVWTVSSDYLTLSLLFARIEDLKLKATQAKEQGNLEQAKLFKQQIKRSYSDLMRRFSIAMAVFSFTFMGAAFGVHIGRNKKRTFLYLMIFLSTLYLIAFFVAKGADQNTYLAGSLYILPQLLMIGASFLMMRRIARGIE